MARRFTPGRPARPKVELIPWKPDVCAEPGCDERHPSFSRDGMGGPWRCREHDRTAARRPDSDFENWMPPLAPQESLL